MDNKIIKNSFDKWLFTKWHFWVILVLHFVIMLDVPSPLQNLGETIGSLFGSFLVVIIVYGIYYYIAVRSKK